MQQFKYIGGIKMKFGKALKTAAMAVSAIAIMGAAAHAATVDVNLYGASAQYLLWNDIADNFLTSKGCANVRQAQEAGTKPAHGITLGDACTGFTGSPDVIIRYSSKASYDGIRAMKGSGGDPDGCGSAFQRKMANEATIIGSTVTPNKCVDVTLGASDVAGESFVQSSEGALKGPSGGVYTIRSFNKIDASGLTTYRPFVVPFGFFANNSVPITNVTRLMAVMIYSGKVQTWNDFGLANTNPIVACLRHAGSGTHATLDAAVMRGDYPLVTLEDEFQIYGGPVIWFNDGSGDMMSCINSKANSIGYADADQTNLASTKSVTYMGAAPTKSNIANGVYEFWSNQWIYEDPSEPGYAQKHPVVAALMTYAQNPDNIPFPKNQWWATSSEMKVKKANDFAYPTF
jgi:ABC-type phosphate transport system substrate-binding protein